MIFRAASVVCVPIRSRRHVTVDHDRGMTDARTATSSSLNAYTFTRSQRGQATRSRLSPNATDVNANSAQPLVANHLRGFTSITYSHFGTKAQLMNRTCSFFVLTATRKRLREKQRKEPPAGARRNLQHRQHERVTAISMATSAKATTSPPSRGQVWRDRRISKGKRLRTIRIDDVKKNGSIDATVLTSASGRPPKPAYVKAHVTKASLLRGYDLISEFAPAGATSPDDAPTSRIVLMLDDNTQLAWFRQNKDDNLRNLEMTEAQLVTEACRLVPSYTPERLAREGMRLQAQRLVATARTSSEKAKEGRGIVGSRDDDIAAAIKLCREQGIPLTPSRVRDRTNPPVKNIHTIEAYMERMGLWSRLQRVRRTPAAAIPDVVSSPAEPSPVSPAAPEPSNSSEPVPPAPSKPATQPRRRSKAPVA